MQKLIVLTCLLLFLSCKTEVDMAIKDYTLTEKDMIPEGVAFDEATQTIYVGSTYKRKIVAIDKNGNVKDFIPEAQDDIKSVIGIEVDEKTNSLWAVSSEAAEVLLLKNPGNEQWRSSVFRFSLTDGKLLGKYPLHRDSVFLNDLTVAEDGSVYVTESMQKSLYVIRPGSDSLEFFVEIEPFGFLNGLAFTDRPGHLFVATSVGIVNVDLATRQYVLLPETDSLKATDIDGLSFNSDYFIGHQSTAVTRFYLSPGRDSIIKADTVNSGPEFDASTTGEVANGNYYFIVNSQLQSGADYKTKQLKPLDSLSTIIIRKVRL